MPPPYLALKHLGLSKQSIACYEYLYSHGPALANQIAVNLDRPCNGLHRLLRTLVRYGFVRTTKTNLAPTYYTAIPIVPALIAYQHYQRCVVEELLVYQSTSANHSAS